jgi:hypothetical protein
MVSIAHVLLRYDFHKPVFHFADIPAGRKSKTIGYSKDVRVNSDCGLAEGGIEDYIRSFSPNARKLFQRVATTRNFAFVFLDEGSTGFDDVLCLRVVKADRLDVPR